MEVHTDRLVADCIVAKEGATVDLRSAAAFFVPQMAAAALPSAVSVPGMLVWDTTNHALRVAVAGVWETVAVVE